MLLSVGVSVKYLSRSVRFSSWQNCSTSSVALQGLIITTSPALYLSEIIKTFSYHFVMTFNLYDLIWNISCMLTVCWSQWCRTRYAWHLGSVKDESLSDWTQLELEKVAVGWEGPYYQGSGDAQSACLGLHLESGKHIGVEVWKR